MSQDLQQELEDALRDNAMLRSQIDSVKGPANASLRVTADSTLRSAKEPGVSEDLPEL